MPSFVKTALSLGGNIGDIPAAFEYAASALEDAGFRELRRAGNYATAPVDCAPGTPDFLNTVFTGLWDGTAQELLSVCKRIEVAAGRPENHDRNASRTLDLDIVLFGDHVIEDKNLRIPHPEAENRLFVLVPLAEIASDWVHPVLGERIDSILARLSATNPDGTPK